MGQSKVSYHMKKLKDAGLLHEERRGKWAFYSLNREAGEELLGEVRPDIHSNLPALETVLEDIDSQEGVDAIYDLGDLGGYAPWPNEVVAPIRERGIPGIAGNYDSTKTADYPTAVASPKAPGVRNFPTSPTSGPGRTLPPKPSDSSGRYLLGGI